jgi:hypothetical protein
VQFLLMSWSLFLLLVWLGLLQRADSQQQE